MRKTRADFRAEQVGTTVNHQRQGRSGSSGGKEFIALQEFHAEMQRAGLALKRRYEIPPLDTIGRDLLTTREQAELRRP